MSEKILFAALFIFSVALASVAQVLLKKSADKKYASMRAEYLNAPVIIAYTVFFFSALLTTWAYRYLPMSLGPILECTGYIFVTLLGVLHLKERLSLRKWAGMVIIVAGIVISSVGCVR